MGTTASVIRFNSESETTSSYQPIVLTDSNGSWSVAPGIPSVPGGHINGLSCISGACAAVGQTYIGSTPNGVYGLKVFSQHFDLVKATRWAERLPSLAFIHLERRDLLGQALSHARAVQTQQWVSSHAAKAEAAYDRDLINNALVRAATRNSLSPAV